MNEPPFRIIAIAGDNARINAIVDIARANPDLDIGLMLRDPEHRPGHVDALASYTIARMLPENVTPICNGRRSEGIRYLHLTSAQLAEAGDSGERIVPPFGASVHSLDEACQGEDIEASYLILSPIFPTSSKPGHPGIGIDALRRVCDAVTLPVFALGGIDAATALDLFDAGAYGIAAISLFTPERSRELEDLFTLLRRIRPRAADHKQ